MTDKCIFIHRRDLRMVDNTTLNLVSEKFPAVIPIFIFNDQQIKSNSYKSDNAVKFMVESLEELQDAYDGSLRFYEGKELEILDNIFKSNPDVRAVAFNEDYTKYSMTRDNNIRKLAKKHNVEVITAEDYTLLPTGSILTSSGTVFKKFTPYYRRAISVDPRASSTIKPRNISSHSLRGPSVYTGSLSKFHDSSINLIEKPGRRAGLEILKEIRHNKWSQYEFKRDLLSYDTTHLSPYNKFGCISIREVYEAIVKSKNYSSLLRQLIWRDFFYNLSKANPSIYNKSRNGLANPPKKWVKNAKLLRAWKEAKTGYPIVDACMTELNTTGYLHNRGRLIVSNFLSQILLQDWHEGEKYFAKVLYDYDPAQNSFGWQISASVSGTESRPPSQNIYNPWTQSKKYDPSAEYIKKWLPRLSDLSSSKIHNWAKNYDESLHPAPIVNYEAQRQKNLEMM